MPNERIRVFSCRINNYAAVPARSFFNIDRIPLTPLGRVGRKKLEIITRENVSETVDNIAWKP